MSKPDRNIVKNMQKAYPEGTRVTLIGLGKSLYANLMPGDRGTVRMVDDDGDIHVKWDSGIELELKYAGDSCRKLTETEIAEEQKMTDEQKLTEEPEFEGAGPTMSM